MSERNFERSCMRLVNQPLARTPEGATRGGGAVRLGDGSPPTPNIAQRIARPAPGFCGI